MLKRFRVWLVVGAAAMAASYSSCIVPPPPGRVIVPVVHPRAGFYYYGRHGRVRYFAPAGPGVAVVLPPEGAYVEYLPDGYTTVVVGGVPYYYSNGVYFRPHMSGYVVVAAPVQNSAPVDQSSPPAAPQAAVPLQSPAPSGEQSGSLSVAPQSDTVTVNVPNAKGGFTPVKLVKRNGGYVGPQGEFYSGNPTVDELKALYGN